MSVHDLEQGVAQLPPDELSKFAQWFDDFWAAQWDQQIERDVAAGKLDQLGAQAEAEFRAGRARPL